MKDKVIVGLSGGVDSSVAAYLLKERGFDVTGVTMRLWPEAPADALEDARRVADYLDIPFQILDFRAQFQKDVIDYFIREYQQGRTPNPCLVCNPKIKWGALLPYAEEHGIRYIATGHYARICRLENGRFSICRSASSAKDQTYALYGLSQNQLSRTLMPLGEFEKTQIRDIALEAGIPVAAKKDSQEICFIPDNDYGAYLRKHCPCSLPPEGNFVDRDGRILGRHKGIAHYTIGQRKGLNLSMGHPVFVTEIRSSSNEVVIGESEDLFQTRLRISHVNFMGIASASQPLRTIGKIRYGHAGAPCTVRQTGPEEAEAVFDAPQRAITPGQSAVFYLNDAIALGGVIES